jgi:hypothetical protein
MADKTDVVDLTGLLRPHYLLHPSTVLLIAADLFPLVGIACWPWDTRGRAGFTDPAISSA